MGIDDKKATELFRQYGKRLYNTALRITLSSSEAEEIMQETLIIRRLRQCWESASPLSEVNTSEAAENLQRC